MSFAGRPEVWCPPLQAEGLVDVGGSDIAGGQALQLRENRRGDQPEFPTRVWLGRDASAIQLLFLCVDPSPWATLTARNAPLWTEEVVEVFLDPFGDLSMYYEIEVNPLNAVVDLAVRRVSYGLRKDFRWVCEQLETSTLRTAVGWNAVLRIPFASLGNCAPTEAVRWRVNFTRIKRPASGARELSAWSPTYSETFHVPDSFGYLRF